MSKERGLHLLLVLLAAAMLAWGLILVFSPGAFAYTLPMSEVRRGINQLVQERLWPQKVIVGLGGCHRIDRHSGECAIRAYTIPDHTKWCGAGTAELVGRNHRTGRGKGWARMHVYGSIHPCLAPTRQREPAM
jgi:hypothetical protein